VDLRDDHVDVTDYTQASDVTISRDPSNIQQRLLEHGLTLREQLAGRRTVVIAEVVQMNFSASVIQGVLDPL
jgi:transcriptional antiterminator